MWMNLTRFFKKKQKEPKYIDEEIFVQEKQKINVKKAFATIRLKNGENIVSRVFYGRVNTAEKWYTVIFGNEVFKDWIYRINFGIKQESFVAIKEDRYVRVSDIMDIINVVESDHEIEAEVPVKKIIRREV